MILLYFFFWLANWKKNLDNAKWSGTFDRQQQHLKISLIMLITNIMARIHKGGFSQNHGLNHGLKPRFRPRFQNCDSQRWFQVKPWFHPLILRHHFESTVGGGLKPWFHLKPWFLPIRLQHFWSRHRHHQLVRSAAERNFLATESWGTSLFSRVLAGRKSWVIYRFPEISN